jgi:hypothetical protein
MDTPLLLSALLTWMTLLVAAILNGELRNRFLSTRFDELRAHQASSLILSSVILLVSITFSLGYESTVSYLDLVYVGLLWTFMTICFEFLFGHYVMKHPWSHLVQDYNLLHGRLWVLVLISSLVGPYIGGTVVRWIL